MIGQNRFDSYKAHFFQLRSRGAPLVSPRSLRARGRLRRLRSAAGLRPQALSLTSPSRRRHRDPRCLCQVAPEVGRTAARGEERSRRSLPGDRGGSILFDAGRGALNAAEQHMGDFRDGPAAENPATPDAQSRVGDKEVLCAAPGSVFLSTWLRSRVNLGVPANINARIGHLVESKSAALEHAHAAAGTAAGEHPVAEELLRRVIPEG
jgi:hypothetical protein